MTARVLSPQFTKKLDDVYTNVKSNVNKATDDVLKAVRNGYGAVPGGADEDADSLGEKRGSKRSRKDPKPRALSNAVAVRAARAACFHARVRMRRSRYVAPRSMPHRPPTTHGAPGRCVSRCSLRARAERRRMRPPRSSPKTNSRSATR